MKVNLKTAKICAIIALAVTVVFIPLSQFITAPIVQFALRFFPSSSHFSIYALVFAFLPTVLYYFGMIALLACVLMYLFGQKETENN